MNKNLLTKLTANVLDTMLLSVIRSVPMYFIWNLCLAQELNAPQLSFPFFFLALIFVQLLLFSRQLEKILGGLSDLYNLNLFTSSLQVANKAQKLDNKDVPKQDVDNKP